MHESRERGDQRIEGAQIAAQKPAYQGRVARLIGSRAHTDLADVEMQDERYPFLLAVEIAGSVRGRSHSGFARYDVRVTVRKEDDIAGLQAYRRFAHHCAPACAGVDNVVLHHVLRIRHDGPCNLARRRRLGNPVATRADVEVKHSPQAHAAQDVGEDVLAHGGCAIKFGGFMADLAPVDLPIEDMRSIVGDSWWGAAAQLATYCSPPLATVTMRGAPSSDRPCRSW